MFGSCIIYDMFEYVNVIYSFFLDLDVAIGDAAATSYNNIIVQWFNQSLDW